MNLQHTVKDALYMLADAWEEGSADSIIGSLLSNDDADGNENGKKSNRFD